LADTFAPGVMVREFGLNLGQLASRRYIHTQRISEQVHKLLDDRGLSAFDGLLYLSRTNFPAMYCPVTWSKSESRSGR
jgi:hypothetical protein